ncbi:hypothetical protein [Micromonospora halophytica]|uniref:Uncharacterized protein n=1 Tax=Micromonospora halophytica TaxID=47864 RepID=A0A1C5IH85_9ACTN|nr:hypothetical protein [Micromonospora halophytica]SCG57730.1 hypothetical protein GA0070560_111119 [Micromonospora halophytica]
MTGAGAAERAGLPLGGARPAGADVARRLAVVATALAGVAHYAVVPQHRAEWWVAAALLTLVGGLQLGWAVLAWRDGDRALLVLGLGGNVLVLAGWLVSRTAGLPVGPHAGEPEPVLATDLASVVAEVVAVAAITVGLALSARRQRSARPGTA